MTSLHPFTTDLIRAFGWTLLHSFWQAFLVFACLRIVLKMWPMAAAAIKYHLSLLSLAGIAGWFMTTFFSQLSVAREARAIRNISMSWDPVTVAAATEQLPRQSGLQTAIPGMEVYFPFLVAIYIIGVTIMTIKLCFDLAQLRQIRRQGLSSMGMPWDEHLAKLAGHMGVTRKVQLFISQHLQVPVMIGFLRPVILLPAAMVNNLSPDQLEAILLHELAHIKRNDYLLNIFQSIVETILFFNPFVWWISKNIRLEREHCCDDLVIAGTVQPLHYAKALVALEEYRLTANPMAMAVADDKHHLFHRIKRIMEMKTKNLNYSQRLLALLIIVTGMVSIAWLNPGHKAEKKERKKTTELLACDTIPMPPAPPSAPLPPTAAPKPLPAPASIVPQPAAKPEPAPLPEAAPLPVPAVPPTPPIPPIPPTPAFNFSYGYNHSNSLPVNINYSYSFNGDTTVPRGKKIIIRDENGVEKSYNSIAEMPEADRKRMEEDYIRMQNAQQYFKTFNFDYNKAQMDEAMKQAEKAMKNMNWDKMGADMEESMKKVDWEKVNKQIAESMKNVDWNKMNHDVQNQMNKIQWEKISEEMKQHMKDVDWKKMQSEMKKSFDKIDWKKIKKEQEHTMNIYRRQMKEHEDKWNDEQKKASGEARHERTEAMRNRDLAMKEAERSRGTHMKERDKVLRDTQHARERSMKERDEALKVDQRQREQAMKDREKAFKEAAKARETNIKYREMLQGMEKDRLIDRNGEFSVEKKGNDLFINGVKQTNDIKKKYEQYLKDDNVIIKGNKNNLHIDASTHRDSSRTNR